jgi:hypothetical protein
MKNHASQLFRPVVLTALFFLLQLHAEAKTPSVLALGIIAFNPSTGSVGTLVNITCSKMLRTLGSLSQTLPPLQQCLF